jgi:hypothetical protein
MRDIEHAHQEFEEWFKRNHNLIDLNKEEGRWKRDLMQNGFIAGFMACINKLPDVEKLLVKTKVKTTVEE